MNDFSFPQALVAECPNGADIIAECRAFCELLLTKNRAYGASAFKGLNVFSKLSPVEAINARMDDKLARIKQAKDFSEDTELDLIGYLILKRIALKLEKTAEPHTHQQADALPETCSHQNEYGKCIRPLGHLGDHQYKFHQINIQLLPGVCGFDPGFGNPCNLTKGHKGMHNNFDESKEPPFRPTAEEILVARESVGTPYVIHPPAATPDTP